jgi:mannose-1-phosphate guanylyltransferase
VIILSTAAEDAEVDYGWIEPGDPVANRSGSVVRRVRRFWEKPSLRIAQGLLEQGCLWNTFVMVGRVNAFLDMFRSAAPRLFNTIASAPLQDPAAMASIYEWLLDADFSREVLAVSAARLLVINIGDVGWSDLGDPQRVLTVLTGMATRTTREDVLQEINS